VIVPDPSKLEIFLLFASSLLINLSDGRISVSSVGLDGTHPLKEITR